MGPVVCGLDANTHCRKDPKGSTKFIDDFLAVLAVGDCPLSHCWEGTDTTTWHTTFNARTFLQSQLNKAVRYEDRATSKLTDNHPKGHILFSQNAFEVQEYTVKDNTGQRKYEEGMDFPTLAFPSDHAIISATIRFKSAS